MAKNIQLQQDIENKDKIIHLLTDDIKKLKNTIKENKNEDKYNQSSSKRFQHNISPTNHGTQRQQQPQQQKQQQRITLQNRFTPLQPIYTPSPPVNTPVVPGHRTYAEITSRGRKTVIFGDSIVKRIRGQELSSYLNNKRAFIRSFPGCTAKELNCYIEPTLEREKPDSVILHVGTNNIRGNQSTKEIADDIINIGKKCERQGIRVYISSILYRSNFYDRKKLRQVNDFLGSCAENNFIYICNDVITQQYLWRDGIHLNNEGTNMLANNFIDHLKGKFAQNAIFKKYYFFRYSDSPLKIV